MKRIKNEDIGLTLLGLLALSIFSIYANFRYGNFMIAVTVFTIFVMLFGLWRLIISKE